MAGRSVLTATQHRQLARQLSLPVSELLRYQVALQMLLFPQNKVGILNRQVRQRRHGVAGESFVKRRHLLNKDAHGPTIGNDVMDGQENCVIAVALSQRSHARQ